MKQSTGSKVLRIASRNSPLAMWQANFVKHALELAHPQLEVSILGFTTKGDRLLDRSLAKVGGKGLFVKELEAALLDGHADVAVHSMKDVPMELPEGLALPVVCSREDPRDALVSSGFADLVSLPEGARVGTSSLRRQCQLRAQFPHLDVMELRGNVNTRLAKLDQGQYDAIVLATAGLLRLDMAARVRQRIPVDILLPAAGQGVVGIECRTDDQRSQTLIEVLHDPVSGAVVAAERAVNRRLQGGCQVPVASYAELVGDELYLRALVGSVDGKTLIFDELRGPANEAESLGVRLAERLLADGAEAVLARFFRAQGAGGSFADSHE